MLLLAKGKEVNDEDNLVRIKSRECKKMEHEILNLNKKVQDLKEKENGCEVRDYNYILNQLLLLLLIKLKSLLTTTITPLIIIN